MKRYYDKKALNNAKNLRKQQTDTEEKLWFYLRNSSLNGIKFRRQVPIGKYIVDFLCMKKKLVIELDGSQHIDNIEYDSNRTIYLKQNGYTVIRFFDNEVLQNIEIVLDTICKKYLEL